MLATRIDFRAQDRSNAARFKKTAVRTAWFLILLLAMVASAQDKIPDAKAKDDSASKDVRLTIVVTGGEDKKPVENASVYLRYVEEHKHGRDKKIEMNLKTSQSGICHAPVIPPGKFCGASHCRWAGKLTVSITTSSRQSRPSISTSCVLPSGIDTKRHPPFHVCENLAWVYGAPAFRCASVWFQSARLKAGAT